MTDLFTLTELASYLQQDLDTATATLLRELATAEVRAAVKQTITLVEDETVLLPVDPASSTVTLPQRPVVDVTSVKVRDVEVPGWVWDGLGTVVAPYSWNANPDMPGVDLVGVLDQDYLDDAYYSTVEVTYSHGSDDPIRLAVAKSIALAVAARRHDNPTGNANEAIDDYSRATPGELAGGGLTADEIRRLRRAYGRSTFSIATST